MFWNTQRKKKADRKNSHALEYFVPHNLKEYKSFLEHTDRISK